MTITTLRTLQPLLHDLICTVRAPTVALSGADGQIRAAGVHGVFHADRRVLSQAVLRIDGGEPESIGHAPAGSGRTHFVALARHLGDPGPDPTVRIDRLRHVRPGAVVEHIVISSAAAAPVVADVTIELACDLADIQLVKTGGSGSAQPATAHPAGILWRSAGTEVVVGLGDDSIETNSLYDDSGAGLDGATSGGAGLESGGAGLDWSGGTPIGGRIDAGPNPALTWHVEIPPGGRALLRWQLRVADRHAVVHAPQTPAEWSRPTVAAADRRLERLLTQSLDDLESLRLTESSGDSDTFLGAGAPWYLTLFGRDSLWAARMMLPLGTGLAGSTLRALARRQGHRVDGHTGEAPGKIMHELRRADAEPDTWRLPAAYYGTVDATPLWISLLHDAWRWGLPEAEVASLLPNLDAALGWLANDADADGDGFLEYLDVDGRGLANQGWKDSGDSIRFADGSIAAAPIALVEVQGYAYAGARHAAELLDAFGRPGADRWRDYASSLAARFRARFWVDGPDGAYPALALDGRKRPVDSLTSNIGHLLGTGLLSAEEQSLVARRLAGTEMSGGYGLRTMSAADRGFQPLSYHCGSIWPHDTAIVAAGLAGAGFDAESATLIDGLLTAAEAFDYRLPEVYGGDSRGALGRPVPYPAACHPQAWSAAAAVSIVQTALGLSPDVPGGELRVRPLAGSPLGALRVRGLRLGVARFDVDVDASGGRAVAGLPAGITLGE